MACYLMQYTDDVGLGRIALQIHIQIELCIVMWLVYLGRVAYLGEQVTDIERCRSWRYAGLHYPLDLAIHTLVLTCR